MTVRTRLTALYAGLFAATATALLVVVNLLLQRVLQHKVAAITGASIIAAPGGATPGPSPGTLPPAGLAGVGQLAQPGSQPGTPLVNLMRDLGDSVLAYQWTVTWIAVAALAVFGAVVGWWLAGRALRPVHRITATAQRLSQATLPLATLHERIGLTGPRDELRELADTFDALLDRLQSAAERQRRFVANASHELRTPLAIQRAAIEIGLDAPSPEQLVRMKGELLAANTRTERLIDGLLILATSERGLSGSEPVDLAELAREVVGQYRRPAEEAGVRLVTELPGSLPGTGDPVLLARLVANLVDNGIRHNTAGGRVEVSGHGSAGLTVGNTGPVVPAELVPELFEPFRRMHQPRVGPGQGAGLGLSIVAAIADAHGARLAARPNPDGGLTVEFALVGPATPDHDSGAD